MNRLPRLISTALIFLLTIGIWVAVFAGPARAQVGNCVFDTAAPSLDNARINFKSVKYTCAKLETEAVLKKPTATLDEQANAHILMAEICYVTRDKAFDWREKCMEHLTQAYEARRKWSCQLDVGDQEFIQMIADAYKIVYGQPSMTAPLIGSGVLAVSAALYIATAIRASDKWNSYEQSPTRPADMYNSYKNASHFRNAMLCVGGAALLVSSGLWAKYVKDSRKDSPRDMDDKTAQRFSISPLRMGLVMTYIF